MNDDDKFDKWLHSAAGDYNRPADDVPRDAMWGAIDAALSQAPSLAPAATSLHVPARRRWPAVWQAAAAVVLLAAGIGIGRWWPGTSAPAEMAAVEASDSPPVASARPTAAETPARANAVTPGTGAVADGGTESYDVAALQHLSRAEVLLTSFRSNTGGETPMSMDRWARDLLADTRLLLDSPAATDARRRQLFQDLELVLAQIVQLPAESSADRRQVQRSIERGAVLSRLRSTIPAGYTSGT